MTHTSPPRRGPAHAAIGLLPALLAGLLLVPSPGPAGAEGIRIVAPLSGEVAAGRLAIEVATGDLDGVAVEIFVDGRSAGTVTSPPYRIEFDFGDSLASRRIRAVARTADGRSWSHEIATRRLDLDRVDEHERVNLVNLYVTVRDRQGRLVQGLAKDDFTVLENGRPQELSHFSSERKGLAIGLVIDSSLTMKGEKIEAAREAATRFLKTLEPEDRALVISFNQQVRIVQDETSDIEALAAAIARCEPGGGTALYDAIYRSSERLVSPDRRKVLIVLSDGRDESESGLEPGSLHTLEEALDRALRSEVIVYSVGIGRHLERETDFYGRRTLQSILEELASATGGRALFLKRPSQLREAFEEIGEELRRQYSLGFRPDDGRDDGAWRELSVRLQQPGLKATTRSGYFAPRG